MNRIDNCFKQLKARGEKGLITFITAGYPDLEQTVQLVEEMANAGADMVELGIPFSDPVADGPAIQRASQQALENGTKVAGIMEAAARIRTKTNIPLIFMTYYNPVLQYGLERFVRHSAESGVDGLIVPDLPYEEAEELRTLTKGYNISLIPLVSPTTPERRLPMVAGESASGFIYCVSVNGVTGAREEINTDMAKFIGRVRKHANLPAAVGFGIAGPSQAAHMAPYFDAVIVGSAIINIIAEKSGSPLMYPAVSRLVRDIKAVLKV